MSSKKPKSGIKSLLSSAFKRNNAVKRDVENVAGNGNSPLPKKSLMFSPGGRKQSASRILSNIATEGSFTTAVNGDSQEDLILAHTPAPAHPDTTTQDDNGIRVVVRIRPRNDREASVGGATSVQSVGASTVHVASHPEPHSFTFDHVAPETTSQAEMFALAGKPIVDNCLKGYNGCLLAYGQTGSGKTYTMLGSEDCAEAADPSNDGRGLIIRVFEQLFAALQQQQQHSSAQDGEFQITIRCSFLEIYNEAISDLLTGASNLALREDTKKGVYVEGLSEMEVTTVQDVMCLLQQGVTNRRVGDTLMNERSSRSHSVFTASLETRFTRPGQSASIKRSRLHLVDLAGSERQKASGAAGERLKEASGINKSLSALGHVIMSLVDKQQGKTRHVPYRDSKLTFLLQDSLGGNAKTVMVAAVSPAAVNSAETVSTLRFADSAKRIKNKAVVNEDAEGDNEALKKEIKRLKEQLASLKNGNDTGAIGSGGGMYTPSRQVLGLSPLVMGTGAAPGTHYNDANGTRRALVGALRREEGLTTKVDQLTEELEHMKELVRAKDADLQRTQMMLKLKESRLTRVTGGANAMSADDMVTSLQSEIDVLKAKLESHPEVKRFAVENLHLSQEVERLRTAIDQNEIAALHSEIAGLRGEVLRSAATVEQAQEEMALNLAEAEAAKAALVQGHAQLEAVQGKLQSQSANPELLSRIETLTQQNDELRMSTASLHKLQSEYDSLCNHAAGIESERDRAQASAQQAQQHLSELDLAYRGTLEELGSSWDEIGSLEDQIVTLGLELEQSRSKIETLRSRHESEKAEAAQRIAAALHAAGEVQATLLRKETEAQELQAAITTMEKTAEDLKIQISKKEAELEESRSETQQAQQQHIQAVEEGAATRDQLAAAHAECATLQASHAATTQKLEDIMAQFAAVKNDLSAQELVLEQERQTLLELKQQLAEVSQQCDAATVSLQQTQEELRSTKQALKQAQCDYEAKDSEFVKIVAKLNESVAVAAEKDVMLSSAAGTISELEAAKESAASSLESLQKDLEAQIKQYDALKQGKEAVEKDLLAMQASAVESATQVESLTAELASTKSSIGYYKQETLSLRSKLDVAESKLSKARTEVEALRVGPLEKEQQLLLVKADVKELKERESSLQDEIQKLRAAVQGRDTEVSRLRSELATEVNDAAQQVQMLLAAQASVEKAEEQRGRLEERLQKEIAEKRSALMQLEQQKKKYEEVERSLVELTGQHNESQRIKLHQKIKLENDELRAELAEAQAQATHQAQKCRQAQEELQKLKAEAFKARHDAVQ